MRWVRFHIIFFTLLLFWGNVFARTVSVSGTVVDASRQPIPNVSIILKGTTQGGVSDENGKFEFSLQLSNDTSVLVFSSMGFEDEEKQLDDSDSYSFYIQLSEKNELLQEQEVRVYRKQESSVDFLDVDKLRTMPDASGGGIEALISTQAGVSMNNELSSQYSVRGGNYDENSVYVNSIEVYRPLLIRSGEQEGLSFVNPDMVESVSFSSGGFSVEYGDKMSSVLDIRYKRPTKFEGSASVSFLGATAYIGHSTEKFSQMHGFRYKSSSYMLGALETEAEYDPNFIDYQTCLSYDFSDKWGISFLGNISRNDYRFEPVSRSTSFGTMSDVKNFTVYFDGKEEDLFQTYFGSLSLKYKPDEKSEFNLLTSAFHTSEKVSYDISGEYWLSETSGDGSALIDAASGVGSYHEHARNRLGATVMNLSFLGKHHLPFNQFSYGVTVQGELIDDKTEEWEKRDSAGYSVPLNPHYLALYENLSGEHDLRTMRFSGYVQDVFTRKGLKGKVVLTGGLRFNYWSFNNEFLLSPRLSAAFFPSKYSDWGLRVATGIYYQSPFYKEIKKIVVDENGNGTITLNDKVRSPRSFQLLMASDYYFKVKNNPFKFSVELYGKYIDRINPYKVDNTQIVYRGENCADGFAVGTDLKLFGEFVPGTDSWISLSFMRTMENIYGDGQGYIYRPTDQLYNISLFFQDYFPGFDKLKFNLKLIWADGLPFGPQGDEINKSAFRMNDYRRVDIGAFFHLRKGVDKIMEKKFFSWMKVLSFNLDVFNLLNIKNVNSYYWVADASGSQYAVPNYLTGRRFNFKIQIDF